MDRSNHYEAAFEAYLRWHRYCYVAVDETRRAVLGETRVKNLDFIVYGEPDARLLIDVKGRRF
ncbi:MAG: HYExAFE family protein, partial [Gemmataceae bacterium]